MSDIPRRAVVVDLEATCWEESQIDDARNIAKIARLLLEGS